MSDRYAIWLASGHNTCPICARLFGGVGSCAHSLTNVQEFFATPATPATRADPPRLALPEDHAARKAIPIVSGCWDYFPAALAAVAELSRVGNEQHNPGEPMHHARGKSSDHADCIGRHLMDRGGWYEVTIAGKVHRVRHSVAVAWRALALAQEELEREEGAPLARGAKVAT